MDNLLIEWEMVGHFEYRAKVEGGWWVRRCEWFWNENSGENEERTVSSLFIPDPKHKWGRDAAAS